MENTKANLEKDRDAISSCLNEEKERYKKECATLMSTITQLQREGKIYDEENNQMDRTIQELVTMNASLEKTKDIIATQLEAERDKSQKELKSSISVLLEESEAEKVKDKSQIALEESEAEKEKLNAMISEVQKVSLELEKKLEDSVQKCQAISSELKEEKISVSTFKEEYSLMKLAVSSMETELADLKAERTTLVQTMTELENTRICLSSRLDEERDMSKKDLSI
ncbi:CAP-Gly domain-containing linker protein 1 [Biomphalaria glabrata]|nr:CAP-Gly domain-containing linker protein 1 [Biomphalaria glabrata]